MTIMDLDDGKTLVSPSKSYHCAYFSSFMANRSSNSQTHSGGLNLALTLQPSACLDYLI